MAQQGADKMLTGHRILVVDDVETNRLILEKALANEGHDVISASNGMDAESLAIEKQPDLIVLDMMMPVRDGIATCQALKANALTAAIPVIFVTAQSESYRIVDAFSVGGADYIAKPFRIKEILARISVHLRLRRAEQELIRKNEHAESLARELAKTNAKLAQQASLDPLTGLMNRRSWEDAARREHLLAIRQSRPYSLIMLDVDYFKLFNDTQGHVAGDECLKRVAATLTSVCRSSDLVGRYGGEEFVIFAPDNDVNDARQLAERVRVAIGRLNIPHAASPISPWVTASFGVAGGIGSTPEQLIQRADRALYDAKHHGRNSVVVECEAEAADGSPDLPKPGTMPGGTVVIVHPDEDARRALAADIESWGYGVRHAAEVIGVLEEMEMLGVEAFVIGGASDSDSALACARQVKATMAIAEVPVLWIGERSALGDWEDWVSAGDEFLAVPVDRNELRARLRAMCRFTEKHRALLQSYQVRGEQSRVLSTISDLSRTLAVTNELAEVLRCTAATAVEVSSCRRVSIMLLDATGERLSLAHAIGIEPEQQDVSLSLSEGVSGRVCREAQTEFFAGEESVAAVAQSEYPLFAGVPVVSTPLGVSDQAVGVLNVADHWGEVPLDPIDLASLELVAIIAGSALYGILRSRERDQARDSIMTALASLAEQRDNETGRHLDRVTEFSMLLARSLRRVTPFEAIVDDNFMFNLRRAVPLHDIGKVAIPDRILGKPDRLTADEMEIMRTHAEIGAQTIRSIAESTPGAFFLHMAEQIARHHHEWYDGTGYPMGLAGDHIPLPARLVAVADFYDAMTTKRIYKDAYRHEHAVKEVIRRSGTQFDPTVVDIFISEQAEFERLAIELSDGDAADVPAEDVDVVTAK